MGAALLMGPSFFFGEILSMGPTPAHARENGFMEFKISGLNPRDESIPEFTLSLKTAKGLQELSAITSGLNAEASAHNRLVTHRDIPGLQSHAPELPVITRALPPGAYYLYVHQNGFETALDFTISKGQTTPVNLRLSHIEVQVDQCGFYASESFEFHIYVPQGPPLFRDTIPCDSRRIITLEPGEYLGVVVDENQKSRDLPFRVEEGKITPVEIMFPPN
ncbi:MAG: carboxypeptidase-like regulatory domain-containing protein [Desulfobacterales bacterium]|nr:carboxypeptidase-like regulatory domain-containing protein [Desulfobacterales bacterium]